MKAKLNERIVLKDGKKVIEVRSEGGKLLFVKTKEGYEMKCPRTKKICLVKYEEMIADCLKCFEGLSEEEYNLVFVQLKK